MRTERRVPCPPSLCVRWEYSREVSDASAIYRVTKTTVGGNYGGEERHGNQWGSAAQHERKSTVVEIQARVRPYMSFSIFLFKRNYRGESEKVLRSAYTCPGTRSCVVIRNERREVLLYRNFEREMQKRPPDPRRRNGIFSLRTAERRRADSDRGSERAKSRQSR